MFLYKNVTTWISKDIRPSVLVAFIKKYIPVVLPNTKTRFPFIYLILLYKTKAGTRDLRNTISNLTLIIIKVLILIWESQTHNAIKYRPIRANFLLFPVQSSKLKSSLLLIAVTNYVAF